MILQRVVPFVLALAALSNAPAASAQDTRLDGTFVGGGTLTLPWTRSYLGREVVGVAADGGSFIVHEDIQGLTIVRLDARGFPIDTYVGAGIARIPLAEPLRLSAVHVLADGSLMLGGGRDLMRIDATGRVVLAFGENGRMRVPYVADGVCANGTARTILRAADGAWILVAGDSVTEFPSGTERGCTMVARIRDDGRPDATFGTEGNIVRPHLIPFDAAIRANGVVEVIGRYASTFGNWVERIRPEGRMLETFGTNGSLRLADNGPPFVGTDGRILPDGSLIFVAVTAQPTIAMQRYLADHRFDPMFAGVGLTVLAVLDTGGIEGGARVLPVADGGFLVLVTGIVANSGPGIRLGSFYKVNARGLPDNAFGDRGYARHVAALDSVVLGWAAQPDGYVVVSVASHDPLPPPPPGPPAPPAEITVSAHAARIQAVPDVVEFHNTQLDHYFLAYDGLEARGIDDGAAGPGWVRTGQSFRPGGTSAACRFYNRGANTHFFTVETGECDDVKRSPGWAYEGLGFHATRLVNGQCPTPLLAVTRLFNNRQSQNDSNHRFVRDTSLVAAMRTRGWSVEGPVFCVKP